MVWKGCESWYLSDDLDFMEMKHAHRVWRLAMGVFLLVLFAPIATVLNAAGGR